jgi:hypothetical protein
MSVPKAPKARWPLSVIALMTFLGCISPPILSKMRENLWNKVFTPPEKPPVLIWGETTRPVNLV